MFLEKVEPKLASYPFQDRSNAIPLQDLMHKRLPGVC